MVRRWYWGIAILAFLAFHVDAQTIDFESGGLKYKALTKNGVTVMFAPLAVNIHDFAVLQVSVSNGSPIAWEIRPEDFRFERADVAPIQAATADSVIHLMIEKGSHSDVSKLMSTYEAALYAIPNVHSTNGFESRRKSALGDGGSSKIKAAAAASAILLVTTKLKPGESTDGAVFFGTMGKSLGSGKLVVNSAGETFEFTLEEPHVK
jgi:hypothetical protein